MKNGKNDFSIVVMSCDKYKCLTDGFMKCLDKYYPNHPEVHFIYGDGCWSKRYREALQNIKEDYVLILLDDFYIRDYVDGKRINEIVEILKNDNNIAVCNFEKDYRISEPYKIGWNKQLNHQMYLHSCQPSIWNRKHLIEELSKDEDAWSWETTIVNSPYTFLINSKDFIIDVGYDHTINWGISRGKITKEFEEFLKKEGIDLQWQNLVL